MPFIRRLLLLLLLLPVFCSAPIQAAERDLQIVPDSGPLAGKVVYTNSHALLIGINKYQYLPDEEQLHFSVNDVTALRSDLIKYYGFPAENIKILLDEQATKANVERALAQLSNSATVGTDDRILVYFSGHGQTVTLRDGRKMGFLIPSDGNVDLANMNNAGPFQETCVRMDTIWGYLSSSPAKHALVIADACYGGLLAQSRSITPISQKALEVLANKPAMQVMTAGGEGETVQEDPNWGHGAFTKKLLEELEAQGKSGEDRPFTTQDLFATIRTPVMDLTQGKQNPILQSKDTEGEFLFITTKPQPVPPFSDAPPNAPPAPNAAPKPGQVKINPKDGAEMVYVPAGLFLMGSNDGDDDQKPSHLVTTKGFWLYKTPVTVEQYLKFCDATRRSKPKPPSWGLQSEDYPIVNVTWKDAAEYCKWAGGRLPTEAEWEKAARGTGDHRAYPWGDAFERSRLWASATISGDVEHPTTAGSLPAGASPYGALDMAGNVWQWTADWYDSAYYTQLAGQFPKSVPASGANESAPLPIENPVGPAVGEERVIRGGSWADFEPERFRATFRFQYKPNEVDDTLGFRCVVPG